MTIYDCTRMRKIISTCEYVCKQSCSSTTLNNCCNTILFCIIIILCRNISRYTIMQSQVIMEHDILYYYDQVFMYHFHYQYAQHCISAVGLQYVLDVSLVSCEDLDVIFYSQVLPCEGIQQNINKININHKRWCAEQAEFTVLQQYNIMTCSKSNLDLFIYRFYRILTETLFVSLYKLCMNAP